MECVAYTVPPPTWPSSSPAQPQSPGDSDAPPQTSPFSSLMGNKAKKETWNVLEAGCHRRMWGHMVPAQLCHCPTLSHDPVLCVLLLLKPWPSRAHSCRGIFSTLPAFLQDQECRSAWLCVSGTSSGPKMLRNRCWKNKSAK